MEGLYACQGNADEIDKIICCKGHGEGKGAGENDGFEDIDACEEREELKDSAKE